MCARSKQEIQDAKTQQTLARRAHRQTNIQINEQLRRLAMEGRDYFPEVLVNVTEASSFTEMDFLNTKLTFDSYDDWQKLEGKGRNEVYFVNLDGVPVVLKAYEMTEADKVRLFVWSTRKP
jgi:hypothetical protein|eukprot:SAG25_NODE_2310_length_1733_cov_1.574663_3_plen_121_part_00